LKATVSQTTFQKINQFFYCNRIPFLQTTHENGHLTLFGGGTATTAAFEQILCPVGNIYKTILIDCHHITGIQPAIAEGFFRPVIFVLFTGDPGPSNQKFTPLEKEKIPHIL